ncbi:MAG: hypothetical protein L6Q84_19995 [Polyangiaceae bacterium]|nr:hypothetical protein [Polyangiaceae bacterium]
MAPYRRPELASCLVSLVARAFGLPFHAPPPWLDSLAVPLTLKDLRKLAEVCAAEHANAPQGAAGRSVLQTAAEAHELSLEPEHPVPAP